MRRIIPPNWQILLQKFSLETLIKIFPKIKDESSKPKDRNGIRKRAPAVSHIKWSEIEIIKLVQGIEKYGHKWKMVSNHIETRDKHQTRLKFRETLWEKQKNFQFLRENFDTDALSCVFPQLVELLKNTEVDPEVILKQQRARAIKAIQNFRFMEEE